MVRGWANFFSDAATAEFSILMRLAIGDLIFRVSWCAGCDDSFAWPFNLSSACCAPFQAGLTLGFGGNGGGTMPFGCDLRIFFSLCTSNWDAVWSLSITRVTFFSGLLVECSEPLSWLRLIDRRGAGCGVLPNGFFWASAAFDSFTKDSSLTLYLRSLLLSLRKSGSSKLISVPRWSSNRKRCARLSPSSRSIQSTTIQSWLSKSPGII